jgi:hypothetical protein
MKLREITEAVVPATGRPAAKGFSDQKGITTGIDSATLQRARDLATQDRSSRFDNNGSGAGGSGDAGTDVTSDPNAPNNPGSDGQLRFASNALTTLNGQQSDMTRPEAGRNMQDTLSRARRMAGFFGSTLTINDAIARAGTSRESETQGSQHFHGRALDISTSGMTSEQKLELFNAGMRAGFTGFGFGTNILHVDTGPRRHWAYGNSSYGGVRVASLGNLVATNRLVRTGTATA